MSEGMIIALIAGLFGFGGSLVGLFFGAKKNIADTSAIYQKVSMEYQDMATDMKDEYEKAYKTLQEERKAREEEKRGERLSRDKEIREIKEEAQKRYDEFERQISEIRTSKDIVIGGLTTKINEANDKIASLEKENYLLKKLVLEHGGQIDKLNKTATGQLPSSAL